MPGPNLTPLNTNLAGLGMPPTGMPTPPASPKGESSRFVGNPDLGSMTARSPGSGAGRPRMPFGEFIDKMSPRSTPTGTPSADQGTTRGLADSYFAGHPENTGSHNPFAPTGAPASPVGTTRAPGIFDTGLNAAAQAFGGGAQALANGGNPFQAALGAGQNAGADALTNNALSHQLASANGQTASQTTQQMMADSRQDMTDQMAQQQQMMRMNAFQQMQNVKQTFQTTQIEAVKEVAEGMAKSGAKNAKTIADIIAT